MIPARFRSSAFENALRRAGDWWNERNEREHLLLGALLVTACLALLLLAVIAPLRAIRADARSDIRNASLLEARLRAGGPGPASKFRRGPPRSIVSESTAAAGIVVQSVTDEAGDTRVVLENAQFEKLMRWIADIEQTSRLRLIDANIRRNGAPGFVNASVLLAG